MTTQSTQSAVDSKIYAVCDIMRRSNCASALQYIPELTWLLFLRALDEREELETEGAKAVGAALPAVPGVPLPVAGLGGARRHQAQRAAVGRHWERPLPSSTTTCSLSCTASQSGAASHPGSAWSGKSWRPSSRYASTPRRTSWTFWTQCTRSASKPPTRPTYSCCPRRTRGCCCAWGRRTTTAASSSRPGK